MSGEFGCGLAERDSLNRLSCTVGGTNTTMHYDSMGRISSWEANANTANTQNYTTQQTGCTYFANAQPHAVCSSTQPPGSSSFCYDANGNMTQELSSGSTVRAFTWMSFNQPSAISAPSYNSFSNFYYDENHQRFEQVASYSGSAEDTEYIGGLMEKMTNSTGTAYRYYVPAGNNFIVYNRWPNGTNAIDYATKDNINSTAVITDSKGALVVAEHYAALGWGGGSATIASVTRHEYTGQEGLDNSGLWLVNMNGRIYNPSGSYFYSPDPHIPDPENTLDYNRYAYVDDNPLTLIDPTGFGSRTACTGSMIHSCDETGAFNVLVNGESVNSSGAEKFFGWDYPIVCDGSVCWYQLPGLDGNGKAPSACGILITCVCTPSDCVGWDPFSEINVAGFLPQYSAIPLQSAGYAAPQAVPNGNSVQQTDSCSTPGVYVCQPQPPKPQPPSPQPANPPPPPTQCTTVGPGLGYGALAAGGVTFVVLNVVGFPEVEAGEGVGSLVVALTGEPLMSRYIISLTAAAYGGAGGAAVGAANCGGG